MNYIIQYLIEGITVYYSGKIIKLKEKEIYDNLILC